MTNRKNYIQRSDATWLSKTQQWLQVKIKLEELQKEEAQLRQDLIELAGNENCSGGGIQLQKLKRKGLVDYQNIPELLGVDLEQYRKPPLTTWRIINV